jgi:ATP-dependent helicase HrpB
VDRPLTESRLQDFFGMRETPRIASGTAPLLLRLLARTIGRLQTTTGLAGLREGYIRK